MKQARIPLEFIQRIPKSDIHLHLDGSLRVESLIEMARESGIHLPSYTKEGLLETTFKSQYTDLPDYLTGFAYTVAVMQTEAHLERTAYELALDNLEENVRYIEVRFAPQLHLNEELDIEKIIRAVVRGFDKAKTEHNQSECVINGDDIPFEYGLIVCAMRCFNRNMSPYFAKLFDVMPLAPKKEVFAVASLELARAVEKLMHEEHLPIVGFDLAGEEAGYPATAHREAYRYCSTHFIKKTVHAGEAYGPESIFQAITKCHANRIGHGTFIFADNMIRDPNIIDNKAFVNRLSDYIASQRITIEVCPTSNLQTIPEIKSIADHPVKKMIKYGISVTICTDNRLVSRTTVTNELDQVVQHIDLTKKEFRNIVLAGFKGAFFPGAYKDKRTYVRRVIDNYDRMEAELLGGHSSQNDDE